VVRERERLMVSEGWPLYICEFDRLSVNWLHQPLALKIFSALAY
jgi:hypothetical protein